MKRIIFFIGISILYIHLNAQDTSAVDKTVFKKSDPSDFRSLMREGNRRYGDDNHVDAENSYRKALDANNKSTQAAFNLGNALYRQQKFDEAGKQFELAASEVTDKTDKARAYHNLGNSMLQQQKLKESIEAYKHALRNNPNDADTKYNLSYAMNLLKQQEQQQQQNQDNQDNKDNKDNKEQQQNQDQQNQDNKDDQKDQNQQDQQQDQKKDEMQQKQQQQQQQINREDAQRILDAIAQEEKDLLEKLQQKERAGYRPKIEKNW